jgi:hypothetical protein
MVKASMALSSINLSKDKNLTGFTARCRNFVLDFSGEKSNFPLAIYFN